MPICRDLGGSPLLVATLDRRSLKNFIAQFRSALKDAVRKSNGVLSYDKLAEEPISVLDQLSSLVRSSPVTFRESASMAHIHRVFSLLHLSDAFVTKHGILRGIVTRNALAKAVIYKKK